MNTWRELPHTPYRPDSDYPNYRERRMTEEELAEARESEIERILADDAELETALIEAGVPKDIAKFVAWVNGSKDRITLCLDSQWPYQTGSLERAIDQTVARIVDNRRSDAVRY